jgi:hypothetical protein
VLGRDWTAVLDCSGTGSGIATLEMRGLASAGTITPFGELLVGGPLLHRTSRAYGSSPSPFAWPLPRDLSLLGLEVHVQGLCHGQAALGGKTRSSRRILSNALDLTLGF